MTSGDKTSDILTEWIRTSEAAASAWFLSLQIGFRLIEESATHRLFSKTECCGTMRGSVK